MNASFVRWALLVIALAGGAFILVWHLLDEQESSPRSRPESRTIAPGEAAQSPATSVASENAAAPAKALSGRLLFAFDKATLDSAERAELARLAEKIRDGKVERIDAVGYADRIGPEAYNLDLSQRRAEAVKADLVRMGIDAAVVRIEAKGEAEPLTGDGCIGLGPESRENGALIECLQPDRRVAITIVSGT